MSSKVPGHRPRLMPMLWAFLIGVAAAAVVFQLFPSLFGLRFGGKPRPAEPQPVTARGELCEEEKAVVEMFKQSSPSVVHITTLARKAVGFFEMMEVQQGTGSGFVWDTKGHVVTNLHVLQGATSARVTLADQSEWSAALVGVAPDKDLAVLRIGAPAATLMPIRLGASSDLRVGQRVFAIGNPFGLDQTLTHGIVSALGRVIQSPSQRRIEDVIQTDAAINPGNSGGPLLDAAGRLVGVNTQITSPSGASAGIGFAVPVDTVNQVVPQLIQHGKVVRPQLGIVPASDWAVRRAGLTGVLVLSVGEGSGAHKAGLQGTRRETDGSLTLGDVIQEMDGRPIATLEDLQSALEKRRAGEAVRVKILRGGKAHEVSVTLQEPT